MPDTLNDFIEQKNQEFDDVYPTWPLARDLEHYHAFLRSALRECAEKTADYLRSVEERGMDRNTYDICCHAWLGNPPPSKNNAGYERLVTELTTLLGEAKDYEFDDFQNKKYPAPKKALVTMLEMMIDNTKNGVYDQSPLHNE